MIGPWYWFDLYLCAWLAGVVLAMSYVYYGIGFVSCERGDEDFGDDALFPIKRLWRKTAKLRHFIRDYLTEYRDPLLRCMRLGHKLSAHYDLLYEQHGYTQSCVVARCQRCGARVQIKL